MISLLPLILSFYTAASPHREVALTFDDCPRSTGTLMTGMERAHKLVAALKRAGVPQVAFFCNSPTREPDGFERLSYYVSQGHLIANHSADHAIISEVPIEEFLEGIQRADNELRSFPNFRKWFRFPTLQEGKTLESIRAARNFLKSSGYQNGYVTIDDEDWYIDALLKEAIAAGKKFDQKKLCRTYKRIINEQAEFFDNMSVKALGRSVKHVILLHETDLNALCIEEVVKTLRGHRWKIITPDDAYSDPIAAQEPVETVTLNQGRVYALAKQSGYKGNYYSKWRQLENLRKELERQKVWQ